MNSKKGSRPRIGILTLRMEQGLSAALWRGAQEEARRSNLDLFVFSGTHLTQPRSREPELAMNEVYTLATPENLDGVIIWTGGIGNYTAHRSLEEFCAKYASMPTVLIGSPVGTFPLVDADAEYGFRALVEHMVVDHGYTRIAFVKGPDSHYGARRRYEIYREVLESHGIPYRDELVTRPYADWWDCPQSIEAILEQPGFVPQRDLDAIMCASDFLAGRVIQLLESRHIRVPEDLAITGFDGEHLTNVLVPTRITTSTLNISEQGSAAIRLVDELIKGKTVPPLTLIPAKMLIMDSCGCIHAPGQRLDPNWPLHQPRVNMGLTHEHSHPDLENLTQASGSARTVLTQVAVESVQDLGPTVQKCLEEKIRPLAGALAGQVASQFWETFTLSFSQADEKPLLECLTHWHRRLLSPETDTTWTWHKYTEIIKSQVYPRLSDVERFKRAVWLVDLLDGWIHFLETQAKDYRVSLKETRLNFMRDSQQWFVTQVNESNINELLPGQLLAFGIQTCCIMLYAQSSGQDNRVRAFFNMHEHSIIPADSRELHAAGTLIPPSWSQEQRNDYLVQSLYFQNKAYGFIVFKAVPNLAEYTYSSLSAMINNPLWGMILLRERDERERELFLAKETAERERRKAEEATQAKSAFLATMSHELRTPLTAILGLSSLLMDSNMDSRQYHWVQTIRSSGDVLLGLISDILDFSKIEAGKLDLEITEFELAHLAESCMDLFGLRCSQKGIDQFLHIQQDIPRHYWGDTTRIRQVLVNLINNAVKFTDSGRITVSIKRWTALDAFALGSGTAMNASEPDGLDQVSGLGLPISLHERLETFQGHELIHFCVKDTGIGIKPENQVRLFQSFSQGDPSTTRKYGGSGLGLTISQKLVKLMGGKLWLESSGIPGEGSAFHFTLPMRICAGEFQDKIKDQDLLAGKRILIIHPDPHMQSHVANCLERLPVQVETITSPRIALRYLLNSKEHLAIHGPADVLIMDIQMRDFTGHEFLSLLRRQGRYRCIPVIFLVHLNELPSRINRKSVVYCTKPVRRSSLAESLVELFRTPETIINRKPLAAKTFDHDLAKNCPMRILLAEDNQVNQMLILALLERFGYTADCARDGKEAINKASRKLYDLVFMDVQMPEIDGIEAARFLNDHLRPSWRPRIVAITANALQDDKQRCFEAGMKDYISKPIQPSELERIIRETWELMPEKRRRQRGSPVNAVNAAAHGQRNTYQLLLAGLDAHLVDIPTLGNLFELLGNPQTVKEMIHGYLNQAQEYLGDLDQSIMNQDLKEGHRSAHSLKSGSYTLGAKGLGDISKAMEEGFKAGQARQLLPLYHQAEEAFAEVSAVFTALMDRMEQLN